MSRRIRIRAGDSKHLLTNTGHVMYLTSGELTEVPRGLGDNVVKELEDDATGGLSVDVDVKLEAKQRWLINIDLGCDWTASLGDSEGNRQERQRDTHVDVGHRGEGNEGREDEEAL